MKATDRQKLELTNTFDTKTTHTIDYSKLERYLGDIIGNMVEFGEMDNDVAYTQNVEKSFEEKYTTQKNLDKITRKLKDGYVEEYNFGHLFSWLYHYGYIGEGDYIIDVSW